MAATSAVAKQTLIWPPLPNPSENTLQEYIVFWCFEIVTILKW